MRTRQVLPALLQPAGARTPGPGHPAPLVLRPAEALWLAGACLFMVLAWAALITADLGVLSLPAVTAGAAALTAGLALLVRAGGRRVAVAGPWREAAALAAAAGLLAVLYLPGFPYGAADKDPGVYVAHAFAIARGGDVRVRDEVLERLPDVTRWDEHSRFPGVYPVGDRPEVVAQFYHLYPATMAFLERLAGQGAMLSLNPLLAIGSALGVYLVGRRLAGPLAGAAAAAVLAVDMIQVWQAKYPTSEVSTQLLLLLGTLAAMIGIQERWWPAAAVAGVALGVAWLDRPDVLVPVLLALGVLACAFALGRLGPLHAAFAAGLALVLPHALWQAFGIAGLYTRLSSGWTPARLGLVAAALAAAALAGRAAWRSPPGRRLERAAGTLVVEGRPRRALALLPPVLLAAGALVAWFRPHLFGADRFRYDGRLIRSYDEINLRRLAWFVTIPGVVAAVAGFALLCLRRWRAAAWVAVGPALLALVLYVWQAINSARLMWWARRYVPLGLVALALLAGVAVAAALAWRGRARLPVRLGGAAVAVVILTTGLAQSVPLARHREYDGSFAATARIAAAAGGRPALLAWARPRVYGDPTPLFATSTWFQRGQPAVLLPPDPGPADLDRLRRAFPDRRLLVVTSRLGPPARLRAAGLRRVDAFSLRMPFWEQSVTHRPTRDVGLVVDVLVWEA
ncbi:MAG TPA: hypothetical protein VKG45_02620 [Actinomycetes bacterium]|nr:hypothetical protein [Actinomycetes bacterium]